MSMYKSERKRSSNLVGHGLLGCLPVVSIVGQGDDEERSPEDQVGHRDHYEHLHLDIFDKEITFSSHLNAHPGYSLALQLSYIALKFYTLSRGDLHSKSTLLPYIISNSVKTWDS